MKVMKGFLERHHTWDEVQLIEQAELRIAKETERAVLIKAISECDEISFWCPKSCLLTQENEYNLARKLLYNKRLAIYAKERGVKNARIGLKTSTLIKKLEDANVIVPDIDELVPKGEDVSQCKINNL